MRLSREWPAARVKCRMSKAISIKAIEDHTGKSWDQWMALFEQIAAARLSRKEIAQKLDDMGAAGDWWAQMATAAYEQHIGRRVPGQDCDGRFAVSVNKTMAGDLDGALSRWLALVAGREEFSDVGVARGPETSQSEKWRYWRCGLADGTRIAVNISMKSPAKAALSVQHEKLESADAVEHWRAYWKDFISAI